MGRTYLSGSAVRNRGRLLAMIALWGSACMFMKLGVATGVPGAGSRILNPAGSAPN